jgi:competence protein ComEA
LIPETPQLPEAEEEHAAFSTEQAAIEQPAAETGPGEVEPELPSWIAEIAAGQPEEEEYTWMPPAMAAEAAMAETAAVETTHAETDTQPETQIAGPMAQEAPILEIPTQKSSVPPKRSATDEEHPLNINTASLIELENLPGVGFIQAQNILAYRDTHGPFEQVEDLAKVPGLNPAVFEEIRTRLTTGVVEKTASPVFEELLPEAADIDQSILIQARNALVQENVAETVSRYSYLIKRERMLDTVIRDLYEALYHFPMDVSIWQTLGDAYVRNNQLQEALDAYIKAEELLR